METGLEGLIPAKLNEKVARIIERENKTGVLNRSPEEQNAINLAWRICTLKLQRQIEVD